MKKVAALILTLVVASVSIFAVSYKNNTYQKLANEYTVKAQNALDAGDYQLAEEYAALAKENAELSEAFIRQMMAKNDADKKLNAADARVEYVKGIRADINFPLAYEAAQSYLVQAHSCYDSEDYSAAISSAQLVLDVLAEVREITPLPKYYIVRPWAETKDCFWNISGRPYVYNNPFLWENLYQANKEKLPQPSNPNLILPGMVMEIPSLTGEYRDGYYSPDVDYEPYSANK